MPFIDEFNSFLHHSGLFSWVMLFLTLGGLGVGTMAIVTRHRALLVLGGANALLVAIVGGLGYISAHQKTQQLLDTQRPEYVENLRAVGTAQAFASLKFGIILAVVAA